MAPLSMAIDEVDCGLLDLITPDGQESNSIVALKCRERGGKNSVAGEDVRSDQASGQQLALLGNRIEQRQSARSALPRLGGAHDCPLTRRSLFGHLAKQLGDAS